MSWDADSLSDPLGGSDAGSISESREGVVVHEPPPPVEESGAPGWLERPRLSRAEVWYLVSLVGLFVLWLGLSSAGVLRHALLQRPPDILPVLALSLGARRQFGVHLIVVLSLGMTAEILLGTGGAGFLLRAVLVFLIGHFVGTVLDLRRPVLFLAGTLSGVAFAWCSFALLVPFLRQASPPAVPELVACIGLDCLFGLIAVVVLRTVERIRLPQLPGLAKAGPLAEERLG